MCGVLEGKVRSQGRLWYRVEGAHAKDEAKGDAVQGWREGERPRCD